MHYLSKENSEKSISVAAFLHSADVPWPLYIILAEDSVWKIQFVESYSPTVEDIINSSTMS